MKILTLDQLSEHLQLSKSAIYKMTSSKSIPFSKIGGVLRFNIEKIDEWFESKSAGAE